MKHNQIRQVVFPILAALIWGTAFVAQDVCADTIGTFTFNAVRYFIAVLALLVLIAVLHAVHKDRPQPTEAVHAWKPCSRNPRPPCRRRPCPSAYGRRSA